MKLGKVQRFFERKNKKDFFGELWKEVMYISKDIILLYRNFIHWNLSKIVINIVAIIMWCIFALPFLLFSWFVWLIDPIPWGTFIAYQMQWVSPILEVMSFASLHTFSFVVVTISMILALIAFLIWNAYSNILYVRLYFSYLEGKKISLWEHIHLSWDHIRGFVSIALWHLVYTAVPAFVVLWVVLWVIILHGAGAFSFEVFSLILLIITLFSIFLLSYIVYRLLFSVVLLAKESYTNLSKHSGRHYIKTSLSLTAWWRSYAKFLFVLCVIFLLISPFKSVWDTLKRDIQNLSITIEYRALSIENPEKAETSNLREIATFYEDITDEKLFANYRGARLLSLFMAFIWFFLFSGLYTMFFVSFYTRILR